MFEAVKNQILSVDYILSNPKTYVVTVPGLAEVVWLTQEVYLDHSRDVNVTGNGSGTDVVDQFNTWRSKGSFYDQRVIIHFVGAGLRAVGCALLAKHFQLKIFSVFSVIAVGHLMRLGVGIFSTRRSFTYTKSNPPPQ